MKIFLALTALMGVAVADIGITAGTASGYHYSKPQAVYGAPLSSGGSYSSGNAGYSGGGYSGGSGHSYSGGNSGYQGQTSYYRQGVQHVSHVPAYQHSSGGSQYVSGHNYQSDVSHNYAQYYTQQQPTQVFKHFYVHAAPEEPEQPQFRQPPVLPAPQKHYKVIFIKTPSQPAPAPQYIPIQQQNEEKTIVYVLAPKPQQPAPVVVPKFEQKPPTKPEVFFIKYNKKEGSEGIINNIVNDYNHGQSGSVSFSGVDTGSGGSSSSEYSGVSGLSGGSSGSYSSQSDESSSGQVFGHNVGNSNQAVNFVSDYNGGSVGSSQVGQAYNSGDIDSFGYNTGSADANSVVGPAEVVSSGGQSSFNTVVSTSQGIPHESYGVPQFRVK